MRACFLGQTICTLGYGVAILQRPAPTPEAQNDQSQPCGPETPHGQADQMTAMDATDIEKSVHL